MKLVKSVLVAMLLGTMAIQAVWADINEDFLKATYKCDLEKAKQLVRLGADVNADNGKVFIGVASCGNSVKFMEYLVSQGLDINAKGTDAKTLADRALEMATREGAVHINYNLVKYLVSKGADVNFSYGHEKDETSNELLGRIIALGNFREGELDIIEYVISKGAFVGIKNLNHFLYKVRMGFKKKEEEADANKVLKLLIKNVKNLNDCDRGKHTIMVSLSELIFYNYKGKDEVFGLLLQNGLDINHQCESSGSTMLMEAGLKGAKYLISKGADVNIKDNKGETALTKALNDKNYDLAEFLISKGAKK